MDTPSSADLLALSEIAARTGKSLVTVQRWASVWKQTNEAWAADHPSAARDPEEQWPAADPTGDDPSRPPCPPVRERRGNRGSGQGRKGTRHYRWSEVGAWWDSQPHKHGPRMEAGDRTERLTAEQAAALLDMKTESFLAQVRARRLPAGEDGVWTRGEIYDAVSRRRGRGPHGPLQDANPK